ncbi:Uncharacterized protein PPKH_2177 [Pseudomonas putida]|nr:Uncharacterized protein PPKH_2177 [Pseudomonas putida]
MEEQSTDIGVAVTFLSMMDEWQPLAQDYGNHLLDSYRFAYCSQGRYCD